MHAILLSCALALLLTSTLGSTVAARGVDLTNTINAARRSQLAYEASMVSADRQLRSLKKEQRRATRTVRKVSKRLRQVRQRRAEARQRRDTARDRYIAARASATEASQDEAAQPLLSPTLPTIPPLGPVLPILIEYRDQIAAGRSIAGVSVPRVATPEEVKSLRSSFDKQKRATRRVERATRKVQRTLRTKKHRVASMRLRRRAALSQRAGSEAALKSRIHSMSRLAVRRATKKTRVRPGRTTRFIWPARGRISQGYGCTGSSFSPARGSCAHFHDGIDIVAGHGSGIRAAGVGVISYVGRNPWDRGKRAFMVVIAHPGGYESLYAHVLPIRRVRVGQVVHKGELIAYMGSTGHSTGTHLHFELRLGQTTVNPLSRL